MWAFGHPFENAGARRLLLQDAYVYRVIDNPVAIPGAASTYKYASLGHTLGTISNDERDAVAGRTGALPPTVPIRVFANDLDTDRSTVTGIRAADESRIELPEGASPLSFVGAARRHRGRRLAAAQRARPADRRRLRADLDRRALPPRALLQPLRVRVPRRRGLRRHRQHGRRPRLVGRLRRAHARSTTTRAPAAGSARSRSGWTSARRAARVPALGPAPGAARPARRCSARVTLRRVAGRDHSARPTGCGSRAACAAGAHPALHGHRRRRRRRRPARRDHHRRPRRRRRRPGPAQPRGAREAHPLDRALRRRARAHAGGRVRAFRDHDLRISGRASRPACAFARR